MKLKVALRSLIAICCLSIACVDDSPEFEWPDETSEIRLGRTGGGLDYCVAPGDITSARVSHVGGATEIEGRVVGRSEEDRGESCLNFPESSYGEECLISEEVEPRHISREQYDEIREAIAAIPRKVCAEDPDRICHYCLYTTLTVDDHSVSNDCCGELNEGFLDAFYDAAAVIERITLGGSDPWVAEQSEL